MPFGSTDSSIGLLFKLKADGSQAVDETKKTTTRVRDELGRFTKGTKDDFTGLESATKSVFTNIGSSIGLTESQMGTLAKAAPIVGTAIVGALTVAAGAAVGLAATIYQTVKATADFGSIIHDAAEQTGLSTEAISALKFTAEQSRGSIEELEAGIKIFAKTVGDASRGSDEAKDKLKRLGIDPKEAIDNLEGALAKAFKTVNDAPKGIEQTNAALDAFGKSGAGLINTVKSFNGDLDGLIARAKELGVTFSQADADAADKFGDSVDTLSAQIKGIGYTFGKELMPSIQAGVTGISDALKNNQESFKYWASVAKTQIEGTAALIRGVLSNELVNFNLKLLAIGALLPLANTQALATSGQGASVTGAESVDLSGGQRSIYDASQTSKDAKKAEEEAKKRADAIAAIEAKLAADKLETVKNNYERQKFLAEQFYNDDERNYKEYIEKLRDAENERYTATVTLLQKKLEADRAAVKIDDPARAEAQNEIFQKAQIDAEKLKQEHEERLLKLAGDFGKKTLEIAKASFAEQLAARVAYLEKDSELQRVYTDRQIKLIESGMEQGYIIESAGLRRIQGLRNEQAKREEEVILSRMEFALAALEKDANRRAGIYRSSSAQLQELAQTEINRLADIKEPRKEERDALENLRAIFADLIISESKRAEAAEDAQRRINEARDSERTPEGDKLTGVPAVDPNALPFPDPTKPPPFPLNPWKLGFQELKAIGKDALGSLGQGISAMVNAWVLGGDKSGASIKKMVAAVLAGVAAQSAVLAIFELAKGFADLFWNPPAAAAHFHAALLFGSLALGSGIIGRAVAGNNFQNAGGNVGGGANAGQLTSGSSSGTGSNDQAKLIEQSRYGSVYRDLPRHVEEIKNAVRDFRDGVRELANSHREVQVKPPPGWVADEVRRDKQNRGYIHETFATKSEI